MLISPNQLDKILKEKSDLPLLDVREEFEFRSGHLPGAHLVPASNFWEEFEKLDLSKDQELVVYCRTASRSGMIARQLEQQGWTKAYDLEGGILNWQRQGLAVEN
jgi:rhodanese-related sulfurtransferase